MVCQETNLYVEYVIHRIMLKKILDIHIRRSNRLCIEDPVNSNVYRLLSSQMHCEGRSN